MTENCEKYNGSTSWLDRNVLDGQTISSPGPSSLLSPLGTIPGNQLVMVWWLYLSWSWTSQQKRGRSDGHRAAAPTQPVHCVGRRKRHPRFSSRMRSALLPAAQGTPNWFPAEETYFRACCKMNLLLPVHHLASWDHSWPLTATPGKASDSEKPFLNLPCLRQERARNRQQEASAPTMRVWELQLFPS